jgi:hypothetical protein
MPAWQPSRSRSSGLVFSGTVMFALVMARLPQPPKIPFQPSDKLQHIIAFVVLTLSTGAGGKCNSRLVRNIREGWGMPLVAQSLRAHHVILRGGSNRGLQRFGSASRSEATKVLCPCGNPSKTLLRSYT